MWFDKEDIHINKNDIICVNDLKGMVLPHAGTEYTKQILNHTLRFKPNSYFNKILILYLPSNQTENVDDEEDNKSYFHEYYVPWKSLSHVMKHHWDMKKLSKPSNFIGYNVHSNKPFPKINFKRTFIVISADFSHHLPLQEAIEKENCAAHALMQQFYKPSCTEVVDDMRTFRYLYEKPKFKALNLQLQWIGRTRSPGKKGVGYLSFLLRTKPSPKRHKPQGMFITAYDVDMRQRECLGQWYSKTDPWNKEKERELRADVIHKGETTSRLTGGKYLDRSVTHYSTTYLYKQPTYNKSCKAQNTKKANTANRASRSSIANRINRNGTRKRTQNRLKKDTKQIRVPFIRGWHGIKHNAFFLPDVMLENTFNDGQWMNKNETVWPQDYIFNIKPTLERLNIKANMQNEKIHDMYELYYTKVEHHPRTLE